MKKRKYIDYWILVPYLALSVFGLIMIFTASSDYSNDPMGLVTKQAFFVILGFGLAWLAFSFKYSLLKNKNVIMAALVINLILLLVVIFQQKVVNGASSWLGIGGFGIQPAEFFKIVLIVYLSYMLSRRQGWINENFGKAILQPGLIVLVMIGLVAYQPDFGGAVILSAIALSIVFASGIKPRYGVMFAIAIAILAVLITMYAKENNSFMPKYVHDRFLAFFDPFKVEGDSGKQLVNSYIAIANGGFFGKGVGNSIQKKGYLPEPYTDFIMSIVSEELGAFIVCVVLVLVLILVARIYILGIRAKDPFGSMLCVGIATMILVQSAINLGGMSGVMPITGVTFPFISYGGSSMITLAVSMGIVMNVSATERMEEDRAAIPAYNEQIANSRMSRRGSR